jgi:dipeptidyl aminopeptidase/acylaminoacyl peptidase
MVAGGWSYCGFMTSWAVTHTSRFKAAVVGAGVTDLVSMATITDIAPSFLDGYFGEFATHREMYRERSPVTYLSQVRTPVLVVHGEADERVPISQGQEFYYELRFLGREAQMLRFPREPHVFAERDHQETLLQHVLDWYNEHVQ